MLEILLILFILFFVWPLLRVVFAVRRAQKQARKAYEEAFGRGRQQGNRESVSPEKEKIFDRNIGEYVEFEEIECSQSSETAPDGETKYGKNVKIERQVVDAEWEDIK